MEDKWKKTRTGFIRIITEASVSTGGKEGHPGVERLSFYENTGKGIMAHGSE